MKAGLRQDSDLRSTDVRDLYQTEYFLERVDGFDQFGLFDGTPGTLFDRARRNYELLDLKSGERFLDLGCGRGEITIAAGLLNVFAVGCDFSHAAINLASKKLHEVEGRVNKKLQVVFVCGSAAEMQFADRSFDTIFASEFIEHISAKEAEIVMKRAYRWLKPKGKIVIFTHPNRWSRKAYPLIRGYEKLFKGVNLPPVPLDTTHPDYKKIHLNEQSSLSLYRNLQRAHFKKIHVWFDMPHPNSMIARIIWKLGAQHVLGTNLVAIASKR